MHQALHVKLDSGVPMVHEHDSLVGGLAWQAWCQGEHTAGQLHLGVRLLLLMQKGVAHHLQAQLPCSEFVGYLKKSRNT